MLLRCIAWDQEIIHVKISLNVTIKYFQARDTKGKDFLYQEVNFKRIMVMSEVAAINQGWKSMKRS